MPHSIDPSGLIHSFVRHNIYKLKDFCKYSMDSIALSLMLKATACHMSELKERGLIQCRPLVQGYFGEILTLLWSRYHDIMKINLKALIKYSLEMKNKPILDASDNINLSSSSSSSISPIY